MNFILTLIIYKDNYNNRCIKYERWKENTPNNQWNNA